MKGVFGILYIVLVLSGLSGAAAAMTEWALVDDYQGPVPDGRAWDFSRIGTNRKEMGGGEYMVRIGGGQAAVQVNSGWAGVWTSLLHSRENLDALAPNRLLGDWVKEDYQAKIVGIRIDLIDGSGVLKVELKDGGNQPVFVDTVELDGGAQTVEVPVSTDTPVKLLSWLVDGPGHASVDKIWLQIQVPAYAGLKQKVFLYSYAALCQCYDPVTGLVRDRARWPVEDLVNTTATGVFALITAIAAQLGYVKPSDAVTIITKTGEGLRGLRTYHNLWPHQVRQSDIAPDSEWSTIDTVIALAASILARQATGIDTAELENRLVDIDGADLTDHHTRSISWGYNEAGAIMPERLDVFGSEALIAAWAYAAATGRVCRLETHADPPTWDGSGFNDQMADLFFPTGISDAWGNNWILYKTRAHARQQSYLRGLSEYLGLSACDAPSAWAVDADKAYQAFGVGGHNQTPHDGSDLLGYVAVAPHYAALTAADHPEHFQQEFEFLCQQGIYSALNNVESFGIDAGGALHFNSMKGSWNLSLQAPGVAAGLSGRSNYLPHRALRQNEVLQAAYEIIMPVQGTMAPIFPLLLD